MKIFKMGVDFNPANLHNALEEMLGEESLSVQLIGKSLSLCIRDIIEEKVDIKKVVCIIAGTYCRTEEDWQKVINSYSKSYWKFDSLTA